MNSLQVCDHDIHDNVCVHCGLYFENKVETKSEFCKNFPQNTGSKNSILDTLEDIPLEVISRAKANITEKELKTGKKVRNDNKNTFIEVYSAYLDCGYNNFNPSKLAKKLHLSRKDINWCLKIASGTSLLGNFTDENFNYASIVILSPLAYVDVKCKINNIECHSETIKEITQEILKRKDILYSSRPEYVACAIIKKFCEMRKINIKCFSKINEISDNALKKCSEDIKQFSSLFLSNIKDE